MTLAPAWQNGTLGTRSVAGRCHLRSQPLKHAPARRLSRPSITCAASSSSAATAVEKTLPYNKHRYARSADLLSGLWPLTGHTDGLQVLAADWLCAFYLQLELARPQDQICGG